MEKLTFWSKQLRWVLFPLFSLIPAVHAETALVSDRDFWVGEFQVSEVSQKNLSLSQIRKGIETLYSGLPQESQLSPTQKDRLTHQALGFYSGISKKVDAFRQGSAKGKLTYKVNRHYLGFLNQVEDWDVSFPSLIQTPNGEPSNQVMAHFYTPQRFDVCRSPLPTLVIVHSSVDDQSGEVELAQNLISIGERLNVLLVYLPHYGPRRLSKPEPPHLADGSIDFNDMEQNEDFFTQGNDWNQLTSNVQQAMLDLHVAIDWAKSQTHVVDDQQVYMLGLSLGGLLAPAYMGLDVDAVTGGLILTVGGGDLASVTSHYLVAHPKEIISKDFIKNGWNEEKVRLTLSAFDPVVWGHRIENKPILWIGADQDELMWKSENHDKLLNVLNSSSNSVSEIWLESKHSPRDISIWEQFTQIFLPIQQFVLQKAKVPPPYNCYQPKRNK